MTKLRLAVDNIELLLITVIGIGLGVLISQTADKVFAQTPHGTMNEETPAGVIDGVNNVFTIAHQPLPWSAIKVYRNGLRQTRCVPPPAPAKPCDYNLDTTNFNATKIVFLPIPIVPPGTVPVTGDTLLVDYTY